MQIIYHHTTGSWMSQQLHALSAAAGLNVVAVAPDQPYRLGKALADAEVIWHVLEPLTADHISAAPRLRLIQKIGVGVNTIDVGAASARGVAVCNMPGTNSRAVAEMTLALMLNCLRRIVKIHVQTRTGSGWGPPPDTLEACGEISGRTVGLVGNGAVPQILAPILVAMGARIIYTATSRNEESVGEWRSLQQLLAESDIVSLHVPLTRVTTRMFDRQTLGLMKPGAIFINTARGELVDQSALIDALTTKRLAAAGLDVFAPEPIPPEDPILSLENVVFTPHVAWQTRETLARSLDAATENCRRLRAGEPLLNQVN